MPRSRKNRQSVRAFLLDLGDTQEDVYASVAKCAIRPPTYGLSPIDLSSLIATYARDNGFTVYDASRLFDRHANNPEGAEAAIHVLSDRSKRHERVIHLALTTAFNIDAMLVVDVLLQLQDKLVNQATALVLGKCMLHAVLFMKGSNLRLYDARDPIIVRNLLSNFDVEGECAVCFTELETTNTKSPFACGHPLCSACSRARLDACPLCRVGKKWPTVAAATAVCVCERE